MDGDESWEDWTVQKAFPSKGDGVVLKTSHTGRTLVLAEAGELDHVLEPESDDSIVKDLLETYVKRPLPVAEELRAKGEESLAKEAEWWRIVVLDLRLGRGRYHYEDEDEDAEYWYMEDGALRTNKEDDEEDKSCERRFAAKLKPLFDKLDQQSIAPQRLFEEIPMLEALYTAECDGMMDSICSTQHDIHLLRDINGHLLHLEMLHWAEGSTERGCLQLGEPGRVLSVQPGPALLGSDKMKETMKQAFDNNYRCVSVLAETALREAVVAVEGAYTGAVHYYPAADLVWGSWHDQPVSAQYSAKQNVALRELALKEAEAQWQSCGLGEEEGRAAAGPGLGRTTLMARQSEEWVVGDCVVLGAGATAPMLHHR